MPHHPPTSPRALLNLAPLAMAAMDPLPRNTGAQIPL